MQPFIFSSPVRAKQLDNAATSISQMESKLLLGFVYGIIWIPYVALKQFMAFLGGYIKQSIQVWFALWFPFKILSANHEVMLQCLLRACYGWILLSSFLSSWCFQVQTKLESWTISFCWQFRGGGGGCGKKTWVRFDFWAQHNSRNNLEAFGSWMHPRKSRHWAK